MAGYSRQSVADIISGEVVKAAPLNAEFNALRDAFAFSGGHNHDGTSTEGAYIGLIADTDGNNKVVVDTANNRVSIFTEVSSSAVEQIRIQDGAIVPVTDDDIDLGASGAEFKNLYIDGTANIDALISAAVTLTGGTIDGTTIGQTTPAAIAGTTIEGTVITASTQFTGDVVGNVTGNVTGNLTGNVTGNVNGNVTGNVTSSGTSTFSDVTISGTLNMDSGTTATIQNLATPSNAKDATPKDYVDTADALKLNLSGGTMSGDIAMGTNKVTGLGTPTASTDAATKGYVDTEVSNLVDSAPAALDTLNELAAALGDDANFSTTITNSIATKLPLAGGTMSGAIAMGTNKITGLGDPTAAQDAATKTYVDTQDATKLSLSGGTMTGDINMGGTTQLTNLPNPTLGGQAANKTYVDDQRDTRLALSGGTMTGNIVLGANKATSTATPTTADDLTRKGYVDAILGSATAAATSATNAANSASAAATSASNAATSESNAATSETNAAASYDSFDDRYLGAKSSSPALDNDGDALLTGALYFDTTADEMRVYNGTSWVAAGSAVNGTSERQTYTATASQTTFAITYDVGFVDVYLNGVKLVAGTDFTATSGTNVVLTTGATSGDIVDIVAYGAFNLANTYTQTAADAKFAQVANNLSDLASASTARTNLGLGTMAVETATDYVATADIGSTVQGYDAGLAYLDGLNFTDESSFKTGVNLEIGVDVQAYDADTAKLDVAQTYTAQQTFGELKETVFTLATSGTVALDPANGSIQTCASSGPTFTDSLEAGQTLVLHITGGDSSPVTFPTVTWVTSGGNVAPTATASDVFVFWKISTTLYGAYVGNFV